MLEITKLPLPAGAEIWKATFLQNEKVHLYSSLLPKGPSSLSLSLFLHLSFCVFKRKQKSIFILPASENTPQGVMEKNLTTSMKNRHLSYSLNLLMAFRLWFLSDTVWWLSRLPPATINCARDRCLQPPLCWKSSPQLALLPLAQVEKRLRVCSSGTTG